ncbi:MAG: 23S rRNA (adenine(2503)-C(2))-methyltransferase RlmN [Gemmatales bacterium]|nr:23S rRNA (adenine(2503)-C(2))-methyltransferase RlmN [Gemmatales bacterium]MDW8386148.1 23S rRNA (adenine(2503)-C(2))-methyltransferase RlmN [Gemmatales bacterium]
MTLALPLTQEAKLPAILDTGLDGLRAWLAEHNWPVLHAKQVFRWIVQKRAVSFADMTDLPKALRERLATSFRIFGSEIVEHQQARDGTHKLVLRLSDGEHIECVLLQEADRRTACISTQVGCAMGCVFCASGLNGVVRNLTAGEIVEELVLLRNQLPPGERLSHIVVMGMGEPLANLDALVAALDVAGDKDGLGIGARHVTISTVGLPAKIRRLADLGKQYHLAISLHAPTDPLRTRIVPTNTKTGIPAILEAADYFFQKTGRQVTFEYVLLAGINDRPGDARELARLLRGRCALINLIPFNEVEGLPYRRPSDASLRAFVDCLRRAGLIVKVRKRKGSEIDAACGQLRRRVEQRVPPSASPSETSSPAHGLTR